MIFCLFAFSGTSVVRSLPVVSFVLILNSKFLDSGSETIVSLPLVATWSNSYLGLLHESNPMTDYSLLL